MKKWIAALSATTLFLAACQSDDTEDGSETDPVEEIDEIEMEDPDTEGDNEGDSSEETVDDSEEATEDEDYELSQDLEAWIPKHENVVLEYRGGGFEGDGFTRTPQFALEDTYQFSEMTTATTTVNIYEYREDSVVSIFSRTETYFRENFVDTGYASETDGEAILLQLPIEVGNTWESESGTVYEITDSHVPIETANAGTFEAIEVTSTSDDGENVSRLYYAEGIGLVQSEFDVEGTDEDTEHLTVSTLLSIHEDEPEYLTMSVYTLNSDGTGLEEQGAGLHLNTNDPARIAIADALKGNHEVTEGLPVIDESVEINFMYLDENDIAHVDFSEELTTEMNAGSGSESLILQAIVNTIAAYYRTPPVEEVLLTVEGEPYTGGHITYEEGETIEVDESMVDE